MDNKDREAMRKMAARCWQWDANVLAIRAGSKAPVKKWKPLQVRRQTKEEAKAQPWDQVGGLGIVCGPGGWRSIDIDDCEAFGPVEKILDALGLPHSYRWVVKTPGGWHIWIRCWGALPPDFLQVKKGEAGVRTGEPKEEGAFDHLEVRFERCQTLLPPSKHPSGERYQFLNGTPEKAPQEVPPERVARAVRAVCAEPEAEETAPKREEAEKRRPKPQRSADQREDVERIKERLIANGSERLISFAKEHFGYDTEEEPNGDVRILGNGGLLIKPDTGEWYKHRDQEGGDALDLIGYALHGGAWNRDDSELFMSALREGAEASGVELGMAGSGGLSEKLRKALGFDLDFVRKHPIGTLRRCAKLKSDSKAEEAPTEIGVLASDVERETVRWLWEGRLALGEMTILDGDPGLGKSTLLCDLSARITTGRPLPGDEDLVPAAAEAAGGVVIVTGEDSIAHTIRPRLEAAGADLTRCLIVQHVPDENKNPRPPVIPNDLNRLWHAVKRTEARLLVIDPLMAHLPGEINAHRDQDVREALTPLASFAREAECAVVVVRHLNKMQGASPLYRGGGSIGIIGAFRIGLLMGEDPEAEDRLVLASNKNNLAPKPPSLGLRLEGSPDVEGVARVKWEGRVNYSASDLLQSKGKGRQSPETDRAEAFLKEFLSEGPRPSTDVYEAMEEEGIAKKTLKRAKKRLGIESEQIEPGSRRWYYVPPWAEKTPEGKEATKEDGPLSNGPLSDEEKSTSEALNGDLKGAKVESAGKEANSERNGPLSSEARHSAPAFGSNGSSGAASENSTGAKKHSLERAARVNGRNGSKAPFQKKQPVRTPKGTGTVVKVEDHTVYVELDSAQIGERKPFDLEEIEPLDTGF